MDTYQVNQKINELAKIHGIKTIDEILPNTKEPNHYYPDMPETMDPHRTIAKLEAEIKEIGFQYFFEADEERKGALAQMLVKKSAQLILTRRV